MLTLTDCLLTNNTAGGFGGGLSNLGGKIILQGCTLYDNHAPNAGGGGIDNFGTATVTDCAFDSNTAMLGGGVWDSDMATLTGCTFTGNSASSEGGGLYIQSSATLDNCTFGHNSAALGGAVFNAFSGTLTNCTLAFNSATTGGGGLDNKGASMKLNNTIVAENTLNGSAPSDIQGNVDPTSGFNLIGTGGTGGLVNGTNGNQVGVANPGLAPLGNYGGPTRTIALLPGSPALDAGSNALAVDSLGNPLTTDQRGLPRVVNDTVDIGAFESQGFTLMLLRGDSRAAARGTAFTIPLTVRVRANNPLEPVLGGLVMFTAPTFGAGGTFPGLSTSAIALIDAAGVAAAPTLTANHTLGSFTVIAATYGASAVAFHEWVIPYWAIPLEKQSNSSLSGFLPAFPIGISLVSDSGFVASAAPARPTSHRRAGVPSGNEHANASAPSNAAPDAAYDGASARITSGNTSVADVVFALKADLFL
jgi:hypothetical protein